VRLIDESMPLFDAMLAVNAKGGFAPAEAYSIHRDNIARRANEFDPNVRARIERGAKLSAADYVGMARERARLVRAMDAQVSHLDALVLPTTPITAPTISEMEDTHTFNSKNMLLLRNTATWNFFDMCAISIPIPGAGLPVGLMLVARNGHDRRLFEIAAGIERLFAA
jgi:aspartyl-tRNA(Asn)/glutamyl-tRNA(Gln) amidotransferase subunit A